MPSDFIIYAQSRARNHQVCKCTHERDQHGNFELGCLHCQCAAFDLSSMNDSTDKEIWEEIIIARDAAVLP